MAEQIEMQIQAKILNPTDSKGFCMMPAHHAK